jgi:hypothetical protein
MLGRFNAYKIVTIQNWLLATRTKSIQNEISDLNSLYVHACRKEYITDIVGKYYINTPFTVLSLDLDQIMHEGFDIVNKDDKYWHLHRNCYKKLLSTDCIERIVCAYF